MMITVALLGFIIVGLVAMFSYTQKAFKGGMNQTDVLEAGRAATELISREMESITPAQGSTNYLRRDANFYVSQSFEFYQQLPPLSGTPAVRTNSFDDVFFITKQNQTWYGQGYLVFPVTNGVGTLYRYQWPVAGTNNPASLILNFYKVANYARNTGVVGIYSNELRRVTDGIVGLRVQACDTNGILVTLANYNANRPNTIVAFTNNVGVQTFTVFTSNAVPAYVDLELDALEQETYEKIRTLPPGPPRDNYLQREASRVHVFRRRVTIHNVDVTAYQ